MGKPVRLLIAAILVIIMIPTGLPGNLASASANNNLCMPGKRANAYCDYQTGGQIRDRQVAISGSASGNVAHNTTGGSGTGAHHPGSTSRTPLRTGLIRTQYPILVESNLSPGGCVIFAGSRYAPTDCVEQASGTPGTSTRNPGNAGESVTRRVTLEDIAHFIPTNPIAMMEPQGWTVAHLPTNFFSSSRTHDRAGSLFGLPTTVRFIPVEYHWTYGEGGRANHRVPGDKWSNQGVGEFAETPTSYRYQQLGNYTITHQVVFRAQYRFNGGRWINIDGHLTLPANNLYISVGNAETLLFQNDCHENPVALGCG